MERRFWIGVLFLALLLVIGLLSAWGMYTLHQPGERLLERAKARALAGDMEEATALADQAYRRWEKYWVLTASAADHAPMDDVDSLFAEMQVFAAEGEKTHFAATCAQLSELLRAMHSAHSFTLWNLL